MLPLTAPRTTRSRATETQSNTACRARKARRRGASPSTARHGNPLLLLAKNAPQPLVLSFDPIVTHATLLGLENDQGQMRLPALLHFPDHGTLRITTAAPRLALGYDALRGSDNFVRVTFPSASKDQPEVEYRLEVTAIYPHDPKTDNDPRYDGYRRDFLTFCRSARAAACWPTTPPAMPSPSPCLSTP